MSARDTFVVQSPLWERVGSGCQDLIRLLFRFRPIGLTLRATLTPARQPAGCRAALSQRERDVLRIHSRLLSAPKEIQDELACICFNGLVNLSDIATRSSSTDAACGVW